MAIVVSHLVPHKRGLILEPPCLNDRETLLKQRRCYPQKKDSIGQTPRLDLWAYLAQFSNTHTGIVALDVAIVVCLAYHSAIAIFPGRIGVPNAVLVIG